GVFTGVESKWYYVPHADRLLVSISGEAELHQRLDLHDEVEQVAKLSRGINVVDKPATWVKIKAGAQVKATIKAVTK
ncbi:MAG: hypothetical protein RXN82_05125, partial [Caldivirga sp.]